MVILEAVSLPASLNIGVEPGRQIPQHQYIGASNGASANPGHRWAPLSLTSPSTQSFCAPLVMHVLCCHSTSKLCPDYPWQGDSHNNLDPCIMRSRLASH